ncbi:hypothetical protein [Methylorubrum extorquens]
MPNTIDGKYGLDKFLRDLRFLYGEDEIDYGSIMTKYFDGTLDDFVEWVEVEAIESQMSASERRMHDEAVHLLPALVTATSLCPLLARDLLTEYLELGAEQFLRNMQAKLHATPISQNLDALRRDRRLDADDRRAITRVLTFDYDAAVQGREVSWQDPDELARDDPKIRARMIADIRKADPNFLDGLIADFRAGKFRLDSPADAPVEIRKIIGLADETSAEGSNAANRVRIKDTVRRARSSLKHKTGESMRSIIRRTKGMSVVDIRKMANDAMPY